MAWATATVFLVLAGLGWIASTDLAAASSFDTLFGWLPWQMLGVSGLIVAAIECAKE